MWPDREVDSSASIGLHFTTGSDKASLIFPNWQGLLLDSTGGNILIKISVEKIRIAYGRLYSFVDVTNSRAIVIEAGAHNYLIDNCYINGPSSSNGIGVEIAGATYYGLIRDSYITNYFKCVDFIGTGASRPNANGIINTRIQTGRWGVRYADVGAGNYISGGSIQGFNQGLIIQAGDQFDCNNGTFFENDASSSTENVRIEGSTDAAIFTFNGVYFGNSSAVGTGRDLRITAGSATVRLFGCPINSGLRNDSSTALIEDIRGIYEGSAANTGRVVRSDHNLWQGYAPTASQTLTLKDWTVINFQGNSDTNLFYLDRSGENIGIGTIPSSTAKLHLTRTKSAPGSGNYFVGYCSLVLSPGAADTATNAAFNMEATSSGAGNISLMSAFSCYPWHGGSGTLTSLYGANMDVRCTSSGGITAAAAHRIKMTVSGGATVVESFGTFVESPTVSSGTISYSYGHYVASQQISGVTKGYGLYIDGSTTENLFVGYVNIGTVTLANAQAEFACGIVGAASLHYDQPISDLLLYSAAGALAMTLYGDEYEIGLSDAAANASAAGRIRRNATDLTWHDGTASRDLINKVRKNSTGTIFSRPQLNLIEGTGITLTVADDSTDNEIDITIASTINAEAAANNWLRYERFGA